MIVSRIDGGLGNQMFQYAFGLFLASTHNSQHVLDLSSYDSQPAHGFMLDRFQIPAQVADSAARRRYPRRFRTERATIGWKSLFGPRALRLVKQRTFGFHPRYMHTRDDSYLVGYWQSEHFFPGLRNVLLEHFQPVSRLSEASRRVHDAMLSGNSIAVHVRRGDYLSNPVNAQLYRRIDVEYYRACVDDWARHRANSKVFVFSNDFAWCRDNLKFQLPTYYVDHNQADASHEDLLLMGSAACCITANSTFSWWGAWLNRRDNKVVYAPRQWFQPGRLDDRDITSSDWISVDLKEQSPDGTASEVDSHFDQARFAAGHRAA